MRDPGLKLIGVKIFHTIVWAFFAGCIVAIPVTAWLDAFDLAAMLIGITMVEVVILFANGMRCPLTDVAARYTDNRRDNFDIYLPVWLAHYNKLIFGWLFAGGLTYTLARWAGWLP